MIFPFDKHIFSTFFSSFSHPFSAIICQKWICPSGDCHRRCRRWPSRRSWASAQLQQSFFRWTDFETGKHVRWIQMVKCRLLIQIRRYLCKFPVWLNKFYQLSCGWKSQFVAPQNSACERECDEIWKTMIPNRSLRKWIESVGTTSRSKMIQVLIRMIYIQTVRNPIASHYPDQFLVDSLQGISSIIVDISMEPGTMTPCYPHSSTGHLAMGESSTGYLIVGYAMAHLVRWFLMIYLKKWWFSIRELTRE